MALPPHVPDCNAAHPHLAWPTHHHNRGATGPNFKWWCDHNATHSNVSLPPLCHGEEVTRPQLSGSTNLCAKSQHHSLKFGPAAPPLPSSSRTRPDQGCDPTLALLQVQPPFVQLHRPFLDLYSGCKRAAYPICPTMSKWARREQQAELPRYAGKAYTISQNSVYYMLPSLFLWWKRSLILRHKPSWYCS